MQKHYTNILLLSTVLVALSGCRSDTAITEKSTPVPLKVPKNEVKITIEEKVALGKAIFFDTTLSDPAGQACASCHSPSAGFANPNHRYATSEGAVKGLFADRNTPSIAYSQYSPEFFYDGSVYIGGQFLDGRAPTMEAQSGGPPLNPVEMHNADPKSYVSKVAQASYASEIKHIYGNDIFNDANQTLKALGDALAYYERSSEVAAFSSKFDAFQLGKVKLTPQEKLGLDLFVGKANCYACHPIGNEDLTTVPALFTEYDYENIGVPKNPKNPFYSMPKQYNPDGKNFIDTGLARNPKVIADGRVEESKGKFKTPTLRNVELTAPYMHNGVFTTLKQVVSFYNTRDSNKARWGKPEVAENVHQGLIGNLKLTEKEEDALVAFMLTLTDGYTVK